MIAVNFLCKESLYHEGLPLKRKEYTCQKCRAVFFNLEDSETHAVLIHKAEHINYITYISYTKESEEPPMAKKVNAPQTATKKPVPVKAWQFDGKNGREIVEWIRENGGQARNGGSWLKIETLEGIMTAKKGWWIIQGIQGEFYPCAEDIFGKSYTLGGK